jgi:hypothetical protein
MENDTPAAPAAPAGWYPDASGSQRYWDGAGWLELPPPSPTTEAAKGLPKLSKRAGIILIVGVAVLLLAGAGALVWKSVADAQAATVAAEEKAEIAAAAKEAEEAAEKAQARDDREERASRTASVAGIESSVTKMAEGHVAEGLISGPVIESSCSPLGGGSTDDLTESTTVFECFVANKDNGDGTMSGYTTARR